MKLSVLFAVVSVAIVKVASASPLCTSLNITTMAEYEALGNYDAGTNTGGCQIGDKIFSDFFYFSTSDGNGNAVLASNVTVTPVGANTNSPGLNFASNGWTIPGANPSVDSFVDSSLGFMVTVLNGGNSILGAGLTMSPDNLQVGTGGSVTIGETVTLADGFTLLGTLRVNGATPLESLISFDPTSQLLVSKDLRVGILASGTGGGPTQIGNFTETFPEVPEPVGTALIGSGLLLLGVMRRRARRG
jgi:hypothetical protein